MGDRANITMTLDKRLDEMTEEEKQLVADMTQDQSIKLL